MKISSVLFFLVFFIANIQSQTVITGKVIDTDSKEGLPFATIIVPNTLIGTVTNVDGEFELKLKEAASNIKASYIGYSDQTISLKEKSKNITIPLSTQTVSLDEIIVSSKTPLQYIIEAVENHPENISTTPFETRGYFSEKTSMVNDKVDAFRLNESVFNSYLSLSADTTEKDQNQLVLFRSSEQGEFDTMLDEGKKMKRKIEKGKIDFNNENEENVEEENNNIDVDIEGLSGEGPSESLEIVKSILSLPFLNNNQFKKFEYTFGVATTYQGKPLIAIDFISKKKIEMSKYDGSLYLDYENLAIVAIVYKQNIKIPFWVNMIISGVAGFKIDEVNQKFNIQNQQLGSIWYPKKIHKTGQITFKQEGQFEVLDIQQLFSVDRINIDSPKEIAVENRFDREKDKTEQIFPMKGLTWDDVNVVK